MLQKKIISLSNGMAITVEVVNARLIKISPVIESVERKDIKNNIEELNYINEFKFSIKEELVLDKQIYKPKIIKKESDGYYIFNHNLNKSTNFILPLLNLNFSTTMKDFNWKSLCNCYIGTEQDADYAEYIYLLYRFDGSKEYFDFEKQLTSMNSFGEKEDVDDYHVLYKFSVDELVVKDYLLIIEGKYSKISKLAKDRILSFHYLSNISHTYDIFYKSDSRKQLLEETLGVKIPEDLELYDKFVFDEEIYLEEYKIKKNINEQFRAENPDYC